MNELLRVLRVLGAITDSKINVKKTKMLRLGVGEDEQVMLSNKKFVK